MKHKGLVGLLIGVPLIVNSVMPFYNNNIVYGEETKKTHKTSQYGNNDDISNSDYNNLIPYLNRCIRIVPSSNNPDETLVYLKNNVTPELPEYNPNIKY